MHPHFIDLKLKLLLIMSLKCLYPLLIICIKQQRNVKKSHIVPFHFSNIIPSPHLSVFDRHSSPALQESCLSLGTESSFAHL